MGIVAGVTTVATPGVSLTTLIVNGLVGAWHHRTNMPHGKVHAELRAACGGPPSAQATAAQLQDRIETIRKWARERA